MRQGQPKVKRRRRSPFSSVKSLAVITFLVVLAFTARPALAQQWQRPDPRRNLSVPPMFDTNLPPDCSDLPWLYNALDTAKAKKSDSNPRNKEALYWLNWKASLITAKIRQVEAACDPTKITCAGTTACYSFNQRFKRK